MLRNILFFFCALLYISSTAQQPPLRHFCGNELLIDAAEHRMPGYRQAVEAAFTMAKNRQAQIADDTTIYTIPVAFHIVWNNPAENVGDSVIHSQMDVLNEDYRRLNADAINTVPVFDTVAADAHIQFSLHSIHRLQTTSTFDFSNGFPDSEIKYTANGGHDAITPNRILNIWIVNLQPSLTGQIFGYSYPPDSMTNWDMGTAAPQREYDGVVLDYRCVGRNNPNPIYSGSQRLAIAGRTATHEIGHYLGLRHVWGDNPTAGGTTNNCLQSDGIDDTPFCNAATDFDCNLSNNTCHQIETYYHRDVSDMVQNYMDYSSETCSNLFTRGQASLMRGVLADQRQGLLITTAIQEVNDDLTLSIFPNPTTGLLTITFGSGLSADASINLYNALGQHVPFIRSQTNKSLLIDMSALPEGIYMADIQSRGNNIAKRIALKR